jgi:glycosyltransferase involved in cell wall biosynthesis
MSAPEMRVALIGTGTLSIPPRGWGAVQRGIWNHHRQSRESGYETLVLNSRHWAEIRDQCARFKPDLLHVHSHTVLEACVPYLIAHPTPLVTTSHDARISDRIPPDVAPLIELADAVIALSPLIRKRLHALRPGGVRYIPNGVDTQVFRPLAKQPNTVVALGNNLPRKRFAEIARFFLARPEYRLTLCGPKMQARPGGRFPAIPTGPNVTVMGNTPEAEVARLLGETEYFVHLCEQEACALVVREAMASGCRVWTGPRNAQDLRNVALSWEEAVADAELGIRAAREARESFDWSHIALRHAEVYAETLAAWRASATSAGAAERRYRDFLERSRPSWRLRLRVLRAQVRQRLSTAVDRWMPPAWP